MDPHGTRAGGRATGDAAPDVGVGSSVVLDAGPVLTAETAAALRAAVSEAVAAHATVRVRLDHVVTFDTSGLGLLVGLHRLARNGASRLVYVSPPPTLFAVMRRRGLHRVLAVEFDIRTPPAPPS